MRVVKRELRAVADRFRPGSFKRQFHAQIACADSPLRNHEILTHAIHTHRVFLDNANSLPTGDRLRHAHAPGNRQRGHRCRPSSQRRGGHVKSCAARSVSGGGQPKPLTRDCSLHLLKPARQMRAFACLGDAQRASMILCSGLGSNVAQCDRG